MNLFLGKKAVFGKIFGEFESHGLQENLQMRKKNFKGRCEKRVIDKCSEVCRTYDAIQYAYADVLQKDDEIREIRFAISYISFKRMLISSVSGGQYRKTKQRKLKQCFVDSLQINAYSNIV